MKTALYRHFDADGQLLYVGISNDALRRLLQHKARAGWYQQIVRVDVQWLGSRELAIAAEADAIRRESPTWNIVHAGNAFRDRAVAIAASNFAIEHLGSARRDGNYFSPIDAEEMLGYWQQAFPADKFRIVQWDGVSPGGATRFARPLRSFDAKEWSLSR